MRKNVIQYGRNVKKTGENSGGQRGNEKYAISSAMTTANSMKRWRREIVTAYHEIWRSNGCNDVFEASG